MLPIISKLNPFSSAIFWAVYRMNELSFLFPLNGTGVRYGESVSKTILLLGMSLTTFPKVEFLKVMIPLIPSLKSPRLKMTSN